VSTPDKDESHQQQQQQQQQATVNVKGMQLSVFRCGFFFKKKGILIDEQKAS